MLTWEQFEQLPEHAGKQELLKGELIELPPAIFRHSYLSELIRDRLAAALKAARDRGETLAVGRAHHEMGYRLARHSWIIPDVGVTHARQAKSQYFEGAPAIAIEVVSPANTPRILAIKTELHFEFGAREVWHLFADRRETVVYAGGIGNAVTVRDIVRAPLLPGFALNLDELLAEADLLE